MIQLWSIVLLVLALAHCTQCAPKDQACAENWMKLHNASAAAAPTTVATNARDRLAAVDLKHSYNVDYGPTETKEESRIMLTKGEGKWIYFSASSNQGSRKLYIYFDGERILTSIAYYSVTYLTDVGTDRKWTCPLNWSLKKGEEKSGVFSSYSYYRYGRLEISSDYIDIKVISDDVPLGPSKDLECFDMQFPSLNNLKASPTTNRRLTVNLTQMHYRQVGARRPYCCSDKKDRGMIIDLIEGQKKNISLRYKSIRSRSNSDWARRFIDENPRNLTLIYSNGFLYVGMAHLFEIAYYHRSEYGSNWGTDSKWKCVNASLAIEGGNSIGKGIVKRLDFSEYYVGTGSIVGIQRRRDYVLLSVTSRAGLLTSLAAIPISTAFVVAVITNSLNIMRLI